MAKLFARTLVSAAMLLLPQLSFALGWFDRYPQANLTRYQEHLLAAYVDFDPIKCKLNSPGAWTVVTPPKYGVIRLGITSVTVNGMYCKGMTFTGAALYYKWTAHNNKSDNDSFLATWTAGNTGGPNLNGRPTVPIVRPIGETTQFVKWQLSTAMYRVTLKPPATDPTFDFSGETVREVQVGASTDTCWSKAGGGGPFNFAKALLNSNNGQPGVWTVGSGNKWEFDGVGYDACQVHVYRCVAATSPSCGFTIQQEMQISAPPDKGQFVKYATNTLTAKIEGGTVLGFGSGNIGGSRAGTSATATNYGSSSAQCKIADRKNDYIGNFQRYMTFQGFQLQDCLW